MKKTINTFCEGCDSEFDLKFDENLVSSHEELFCPFCSEKIEEIPEENIEEEYDNQEDMWE